MGSAVGPIITSAIVRATGNFTWALVFSAVLVVIGILNCLFLLGKVEPIMDEEKVHGHQTVMINVLRKRLWRRSEPFCL